MTLTILSLSLCGGLLSESAPRARLFAQNDEVLAAPDGRPQTVAELRASMPGFGGPIGLMVGGAALVFSTYLLPLFLPYGAVAVVAIVMVIAGGIMESVGVGTLIGTIVRRVRIQRQIRRLEHHELYYYGSREAPQAPLAMLTFQLP